MAHPPYSDPGLSADLGRVYASPDECFKAVYWVARGPGRLLEQPKSDELICILEGAAQVEWHGEVRSAAAGDTILWLKDDPPRILVDDHLTAFCVTYKPQS